MRRRASRSGQRPGRPGRDLRSSRRSSQSAPCRRALGACVFVSPPEASLWPMPARSHLRPPAARRRASARRCVRNSRRRRGPNGGWRPAIRPQPAGRVLRLLARDRNVPRRLRNRHRATKRSRPREVAFPLVPSRWSARRRAQTTDRRCVARRRHRREAAAHCRRASFRSAVSARPRRRSSERSRPPVGRRARLRPCGAGSARRPGGLGHPAARETPGRSDGGTSAHRRNRRIAHRGCPGASLDGWRSLMRRGAWWLPSAARWRRHQGAGDFAAQCPCVGFGKARRFVHRDRRTQVSRGWAVWENRCRRRRARRQASGRPSTASRRDDWQAFDGPSDRSGRGRAVPPDRP